MRSYHPHFGSSCLITFFWLTLSIRNFVEVKMARTVSVGFHSSPSLLLSCFSPGVIRFEIFRLTAPIKGNDVTECLHFVSLFVRWPTSQSNRAMSFLVLLLLLIFLKSHFLWCCPTETVVKLCQHKFSPCSSKQHLCRDATCPCFWSLYTSFVHLSSRRSLLCQALFCPACLISSTLELPASVLLKDCS